ncbi:trophozoite exported protein 1 [Plasmodium reichenowi]|uniref:Trophozoite exported protein 1 n=1 Tax=Plasmodium reichenowi TaxID=5854 RepID=A0A2P9D8R7_PLARE|nr:trophozoite exported protein 1 [Plasmodium reichenowi]
MSNKKRSKNENDESTSLPLENSELLIEYIHNLKSCLNVYRREIQEKNKYISVIKNDLSFHECILTNVNVVWSVFNNDLLNLLCNNEQKEDGEEIIKQRNIGDEMNEYNNLTKLQNDENIKDNNMIKEDLEDDANQNILMKSPYYNIENFLQVFLKYINKKKKKKKVKVKDEGKKEKIEDTKYEQDEEEENEEEEEEEEEGEEENKEDEEFFKTFVSFNLYHTNNEENISYDKNLVKQENDNKDESRGNDNMCGNYDIYNERGEMLDKGKSYSGDEKINRSDNAKSYDYVKNECEEQEEKENMLNNKKRSLECNPNEAKRICFSLEEKIGTVQSVKLKEYNESSKENIEKNKHDDNNICNYFSNNEGENVIEREDKSFNKMNNKNYRNEEEKKKNEINFDYLKKRIKNNQEIFEETIQKCFLINLKKTLNLINKIMYLKNVEFRKYNLDYIRKINYEKCFYYKNYIEIKKKIIELQKDNESLKIQVDRLEKKKATLIYKLNNDNIRKDILDNNIKNYQNGIDYSKVSYFDEGENPNKRNNKNYRTDNNNNNDDNNNNNNNYCYYNNYNSDDNYNSEDSEYNSGNYRFRNNYKKDSLNEDDVKKNSLNVYHKIKSDSNIFVHVENIITKQNIIHSEPFRNLLKESNELYITLKEKEKENIILKNEILKMENKKDEEYEDLLNNTIEDKKELTRSIKELELNMMTCNMEKDKISNKVNTLEYEINVLKNIDKNQTMQLQQKESDILKLKLYIEKLKLSEKNLKDKIILLENEKDKMLSGIIPMKDNSFNEEFISEEGKIHVRDIQNDKDEKYDDEKKKRFKELFIENQKLKEELNKKRNVEEELHNLRKNYNIINEEIEEITKEFEKKQEQVDEMILQIKNKELELLEKFNNKMNKAYVEEKLKELKDTYEEKMKHINNIYKKHDDFVNIYLNLFFQARKNAILSDSQREEQMNLFIKLKDKYDIIFQKKIELTDILKNVYDCNKKLIGHCQDLEKENSTLQNKLSNEIKNSKMLSKNLSKNSDDHLLIEENNELRRRLICSVCMENFRNYIIIKCGHIYCNNCIFNNLKTRNRKCPQCKVPFDKKDLQKIFLD